MIIGKNTILDSVYYIVGMLRIESPTIPPQPNILVVRAEGIYYLLRGGIWLAWPLLFYGPLQFYGLVHACRGPPGARLVVRVLVHACMHAGAGLRQF